MKVCGVPWLSQLPWRFLSGFLCGSVVLFLWHDAKWSGRELEIAQNAAQATLNQSIVVAKADAKATQELKDAQAKTDELANRLAAGTSRLSIKAACVPDAGSSSVDARETAILNRESEQWYINHRRLLEKKEAQISALQGIISGMQGRASP